MSQTAPGEPANLVQHQALTADQIEALADRLLARGTSRLQKNAPNLAGDLRTAGHVTRGLLSKLDKTAGNVVEAHRLPAEIAIQAEA